MKVNSMVTVMAMMQNRQYLADSVGADDDDHAFLRGVGSVAVCGNQDRKRGWLSRWNVREQPSLRSTVRVVVM